NENLARELMELFTLGIGPYSEDDIKQAARALTGWRLAGDEVRLIPSRHDPGTKTILGRTAAFDTDGLAGLLLDHPATSRRLAWRPILDHDPLGHRAGQLRRGLGRRRGGRPGHVVRPDRAGRPPWPGAKPVILPATAALCRWPRGPARCAGIGPACPRPTV